MSSWNIRAQRLRAYQTIFMHKQFIFANGIQIYRIEIPAELITKSFKSCGITNALDSTEDEVVWDEGEEAEDPEDAIDNEFETESEGEDDE